MKYDIFISYRRNGGDTLAQLLYDRLTHRGYRVFLDIESLNAGKFNEKLLNVIEECKDIIIVLPPNALERCHNEGDWLYREIKHSIEHSKNIIPVLMKDFIWPDNIPEAISEIRNYNGILDNKDYFDAVIDKISSLLKSKPAIGGHLTLNFHKRKNNFKTIVKRRKKLLLIVILVLFLCCGILGFLQYKKTHEKLISESYISIELSPSEEMSASEYYDAIEILKQRFAIFAKGYDYTFDEEKDKINVLLPIDVYHDVDPLNITKSTITRPGELYIAPATYNENDSFLHIERSSIENIELVSKVPVEFDLKNYNMKGTDEYQYFALTLDPQTANTINEWMHKTNALGYHLYLDYEDFGYSNSFYNLMNIDTDTNTIYFIVNCQYENFLNTALYNFTHDTFSHAFNVNMKLPVKWENTKNAKYMLGQNQCNESDLSGSLIRLDFQSYAEDLTEGEYQDTIISFKTRVDALDTPYSFGYYSNDASGFSIKIAPSHLNPQIIDLLGTISKFNITSTFYEITTNYSMSSEENFQIITDQDNHYSLQITPNNNWQTTLNESEWINILDESTSIYLCIDQLPFIEMTLGESFDGKTFTFDNMCYFGLDKIDSDHAYLLDFIKTIQFGPKMPHILNFKNIYYENMDIPDNTASLFPLYDVTSENVRPFYESIIPELPCIAASYVKVEDNGQSVFIELELPFDDAFDENVSEILQEIYTNGNIEDRDTRYIYVSFKENLNMNSYLFRCVFCSSLYSHKVETSFFTYLSIENLTKLEETLNTNPFYQTLTINTYNLDANGKISFH